LILQVAALVSGGKDSALALYHARQMGYHVKFLVTMIPQRNDSWMFHFPNIHLTKLFAEASCIPLVTQKTSGLKEREVKDLKRILKTLPVEGIVAGTISSEYQRKRISNICEELKLKSITPLWRSKPIKLLRELVALNFKIIITGAYAYGFDESWLGRQLDTQTISDLLDLNRKFKISIVGEGGEYETLVLDTPFFQRKIVLLQTRKVWTNQSGYLQVEKSELVEKHRGRR
jgi:ABC transporter with metal-binding/Fe-S-binding domain ATP-binding protein